MSDSVEVTIESKITECEAFIDENPYVAENYDNLLDLLQVSSNPTKLHDVYKQKLTYFRLKQKELLSWYEILLKIDDDLQRASLQVEYFELILLDYPNVPTWKRYLDQCETLIKMEIIDDDDYRLILQRAMKDCFHDFENCHEIWNIMLSYFYDRYLKTKNQDHWDHLVQLHLSRLGQSHAQLGDSFSEFSSLISKHDAEHYDQQMTNANKIYSDTKRNQHYYEHYEIKIKSDPSNPQVYIDYIENVAKYESRSMIAIFNRAISTEYSWSPEWQPVWMTVIYQLYAHDEMNLLESLLRKFVRTFAESCRPYAELIRNCIEFDDGETLFNESKERIDNLDLMTKSDYSEWKLLASAIIQYRFNAKDNENLYVDALKYVEFAIDYNNDMLHSVEKLACSIFQKLGDLEEASKIVDLMVDRFNEQADVWLYMINYLTVNSESPETLRQTFQNALLFAAAMDAPEKIIEEWLIFEQANGDISSYRDAVLECNAALKFNLMNKVEQLEAKKADEVAKVEKAEKKKKSGQKRKLSETQEPVRSREEFIVKVTNIENVSKEDLIAMFQDCGEIREISVLENSALIEFTTDQSVLSALTKDHKRINDHEIAVTKLGNSTLYVNNFPSTYTQSQIQDKFSTVGPIVSIRFPHQNNPNKTKRFCYVQYVNPDDAKRAIVLYNGEMLHDDQFNTDFKLQIMISRPHERKQRSSPISERKIRVSNLSFELGEDQIKDIFVKCGEIDSIVIPKKNKKYTNEGVAIIVFESIESVDRALDLNETEISGRKLHVERPRHHHHQKEVTVKDFNKLSTIGLINVDTTLKSNDIKAYFEKFGAVEKSLVLPDSASALVEFASPTTAGTVSMSGDKIRLGQTEATITEMNTAIAATAPVPAQLVKSTRIMIPASVKRRKKN